MSYIPVIRGVIGRRILINYQVDPSTITSILPAPFRPKLIDGVAIAGICLIHLQAIRPKGMPSFVGFSSENAAHRIAVTWDEQGVAKEGVYIPRRDTSSSLSTLVGGKLFPGMHHRAAFTVADDGYNVRVALVSEDGQTRLRLVGQEASALPSSSVFTTLDDASEFFQRGSVGYSATQHPDHLDCLELRSFNWKVRPFHVDQVEASFFDDQRLFPAGSIKFDSALIMRNVEHEWHSCDQLSQSSYDERGVIAR